MRIIIIALLLCAVVHAAEIEEAVKNELEEKTTTKVIVQLKDIPEPDVLSKASPERRAQQLEARRERIIHEHEKLLKRLGLKKGIRSYPSANALSGTIDSEALKRISMEPAVLKIYTDPILKVELADSTGIIRSNEVNRLRIDHAQIKGQGQTVCVIDTGIDYDHPGLGGGFGNVVIDGYDYANDDSDPMDDHSHGTHVAGIIASRNLTYKGVAPEAKLASLKVCNMYGSCAGSDMIAGVEWCVANSARHNITAITISIGDSGSYNSDSCPNWMDSALRSANEAGIFVTVSSGNNYHKDGISYPACSSYVTAVGAVSKTLEIPGYSNSGALLDLLAPGGTSDAKIMSTQLAGSFIGKYGTSMAAPHAAAAAALMQQFSILQDNRLLSAAELFRALNSTGTTLTDSNNITNSLIDAYKAVISLDNKSPTISILTRDRIKVQENTYTIKAEANEFLSSCLLQLNGQNLTGITTENNCSITITGAGQHSYIIFANDSAGNYCQSIEQQILLNDTPPVIESFYPEAPLVNIREPENLFFNISYTEPNSQNVSIHWTMNHSNVANGSNYTLIGSYTSAGTYLIKVRVNDSALAAEHNWTVIVNNTNRHPTIDKIEILPVNPGMNSELLCNVSASDQDNDSMSYFFDWHREIWKSFNTITLGIGNLTYNSTWNCSAVVFDGTGNSTRLASRAVTLNNLEPNITHYHPEKYISIKEPDNISFSINATDNSPLTITWIINGQSRPGSATLLIVGNYSAAGYYEITALVSDGTLKKNMTWFLTINNTNRQPEAQNIGRMIVYRNTNITIDLANYFSDPDGDVLIFSANPSENMTVSVDANIAIISPLENWTGTGHVVFNATDSISSAQILLNVSYSKDLDFDGHPAISQLGDDCNDNDALVYPGAPCTLECYANSKYGNDCVCRGGSYTCAGSGGGGGTIITKQKQAASAEKQNVKIIFLVNQEKVAATRVVINGTQSNMTLIVHNVDTQGDDAYAYFEIMHNMDESNINSAEIYFRVNSTWLEDREKTTVELHRQKDSWQKLKTRIVNDTPYYTEYTSVTPGLSLFRITAARKENIVNETKAGEDTQRPANLTVEQPQIIHPEQLNDALVVALTAAIILFLAFAYVSHTARLARLEEYIHHKLWNGGEFGKILQELGWQKRHIEKCSKKASKRIRKAIYPQGSPLEEKSPQQAGDRQCSQKIQQRENSAKH